jgi:hypothetical protein
VCNILTSAYSSSTSLSLSLSLSRCFSYSMTLLSHSSTLSLFLLSTTHTHTHNLHSRKQISHTPVSFPRLQPHRPLAFALTAVPPSPHAQTRYSSVNPFIKNTYTHTHTPRRSGSTSIRLKNTQEPLGSTLSLFLELS